MNKMNEIHVNSYIYKLFIERLKKMFQGFNSLSLLTMYNFRVVKINCQKIFAFTIIMINNQITL